MGRHRKPAEAHALAGNPGKRRQVTDEELEANAALAAAGSSTDVESDDQKILDAGDIHKPLWVQGFGEEFWNDHAAKLRQVRLLKSIDVTAFGTVCLNYQMMREALQDIMDNGMIVSVETKHGRWRRMNPAFNVYKACSKDLLSGMAEFGLTPSGRARAAIAALEANKNTNPSQPALPGTENTEPPHGHSPVGALARASTYH